MSLVYTNCSVAPCWPNNPKSKQKMSHNIWQWLYFSFDHSSLLRVVIVCVNVCVHMATCEEPLGWAAQRQRERERGIQSGPQAELLIGLVKAQGYRWVTKPPLITNHFCHESRLERKKQQKVCLKQRKVMGCAHFSSQDVSDLAGLLTFPFVSFTFLPVLFM